MYVSIQTVDGQVFQSDEFDMVTSGLTPREFDETMTVIEDILSNWRSAEHIAFDIGGRKRYFNPANVLWAEIVP